MILNVVEDKNPKCNSDSTPLHHAAKFGHVEIFNMIFDEIEEKSPVDKQGFIPLDLAIVNGQKEVVKIMLGEIEETENQLKSELAAALSHHFNDEEA